jgi:hypothetical protein
LDRRPLGLVVVNGPVAQWESRSLANYRSGFNSLWVHQDCDDVTVSWRGSTHPGFLRSDACGASADATQPGDGGIALFCSRGGRLDELVDRYVQFRQLFLVFGLQLAGKVAVKDFSASLTSPAPGCGEVIQGSKGAQI